MTGPAYDVLIAGAGLAVRKRRLRYAGAVLPDRSGCSATSPNCLMGGRRCNASPFAGGAKIRFEPVQSANDQATTATTALTGALEAYDAVP